MTTPTPTPQHKLAGVEALFGVAFSGSGVTLASLVATAHNAFPTQTAVVATAITGALAFIRKEAPYVRDLVKVWNVARKDAAVQKTIAKLTNTQAFKDAVKAEKEAEKAIDSNAAVAGVADAVVADAKTAVADALTTTEATTTPRA